MNRKLWSNEEKVAIILEILRGDESVAVICTRHGMSATQVYKWLDRFLEGGRRVLKLYEVVTYWWPDSVQLNGFHVNIDLELSF